MQELHIRNCGNTEGCNSLQLRGLSGSFIEEMAFELGFEGGVNCSEKEEREGRYSLRR